MSDRVPAVLRALHRLRAPDPTPWSEGLSPANARRCRDLALDLITEAGLRQAAAGLQGLPEEVALIAARGVYTAPLEWVALLLAAGARVWIKAPGDAAEFLTALVAACAAEGLPARLGSGHRVPDSARGVVAFGSDDTTAALRLAYPDRRLALYGHRFSVAIWAPSGPVRAADRAEAAAALALDHALYDTRGCMAPAAVWTTDDPAALSDALATAMAEAERTLPRGVLHPSLGPLLRERLGLARVLGRVRAGEGWAVATLPADRFLPVALPRVVTVIPAVDLEEIQAQLQPWAARLSAVGTQLTEGQLSLPGARVCPLGQMQTPAFPRAHDGRAMLSDLTDQASGAAGGNDTGPRIPE